MKDNIRVSVRNLVEFLGIKGSIDSRFMAGGYERANEGAKLHRKIQKDYPQGYQAEVALAITVDYQELSFTVEGRADGVFKQDNHILIDEIKTTDLPLEMIEKDYNPLHWSQAFCYGYLFAVQEGAEEATIQLTYIQTKTQQKKLFQQKLSLEEMKEIFFQLIKQYYPWAKLQLEWINKRNESLLALPFPFESYRKGQRNLAAYVYRAIGEKKILFCQAPTGTGKTISTLFPAVKALGEQKTERIFYLTAKTITRKAAEDAVESMAQKGGKLRSLTLTAKESICFLETVECIPERCPYANGYYDRLQEALFEILQQKGDYTRQSLEEYAKKYCLCPYELSLDLSLWCDIIICDYNYLFDPFVYLRRFFSQAHTNSVFLIDEAHNLVDRARNMYSAKITKSEFYQLKKQLGQKEKILKKALHAINAEFLELKKQSQQQESFVQKQPYDKLNIKLLQFCGECEKWLEENREAEITKELLPVYFSAKFYLRILEYYGENYAFLVHHFSKDIIVELCCLDASTILNKILKQGKAAILFSATLSPISYFSTVLGGGEQAGKVALCSPFPPENLGIYIADTINTKYHYRDQSAQVVARYIYETCQAKKGNYFVYFPSYQYQQQVYNLFIESYPQVKTLLQQPNQTQQDRERFLSFFVEQEEAFIGFCVLGGIYSEGIDLIGDKLIGTIIVGVGLPQINPKQELIKSYYDSVFQQGFEYAYQYPGMNKVLQAAGRVIRSQKDKGIVVLIDSRFTSRFYQSLFPIHWAHWKRIDSIEKLQKELNSFWKGPIQE